MSALSLGNCWARRHTFVIRVRFNFGESTECIRGEGLRILGESWFKNRSVIINMAKLRKKVPISAVRGSAQQKIIGFDLVFAVVVRSGGCSPSTLA